MTGVGSQRVTTSGIDEDSPAIFLYQEGVDGGAPVPFARQECLGQQPVDLSGGRAMQIVGRDRHESVIERRDQQLPDADPLKSRRLPTVQSPCLGLHVVVAIEVDARSHTSQIPYEQYVCKHYTSEQCSRTGTNQLTF